MLGPWGTLCNGKITGYSPTLGFLDRKEGGAFSGVMANKVRCSGKMRGRMDHHVCVSSCSYFVG